MDIKELSKYFLSQEIVRYYPGFDSISNTILRKTSCDFLERKFFVQYPCSSYSKQSIQIHTVSSPAEPKDMLNVFNPLTVYRTTRRREQPATMAVYWKYVVVRGQGSVESHRDEDN